MIRIFKMDMHRLTHSPVFYVALAFITIMAVALPMSGMSNSLDGLLGVSRGAVTGDDFMTAAMGAGVINILLSIILSLFVCGDYSGGFAKNLFTTHADPKNYIGGKMLSMAAAGSILLLIYTLEAVISLLIFNGEVTMSGNIFGLIMFLVEKCLLSCALSAVVLLILVFTRNTAWGITAGFLIATGGLAMGVSLLGEWLNWGWLVNIFSVTISGAAALCTLSFSLLAFLRVLCASAAWIAIGCAASKRIIKSKDI